MFFYGEFQIEENELSLKTKISKNFFFIDLMIIWSNKIILIKKIIENIILQNCFTCFRTQSLCIIKKSNQNRYQRSVFIKNQFYIFFKSNIEA